MGVLPLNFVDKADYDKIVDLHDATFSIEGMGNEIKARQEVTLKATPSSGDPVEVPVVIRLDTPAEIDYYKHGGILPFVLRQLLQKK
jgi:aconitate hydratase